MMKKSSCKVSVATICMLAIFLGLAPLTAMAHTSSYGIEGIDNLAFLYQSGSSSISGTSNVLKDGVSLIGTGSDPFGDNTGWKTVFSESYSYEATYLGYEASKKDQLKKGQLNKGHGGRGDPILFKNQQKRNSSSVGDTASFDVNEAYYRVRYRVGYGSKTDTNFLASNLKVYSLSGKDLNSYANMSNFDDKYIYYVVGFGDSTGDGDYDDLVIACKTPNTVPIPGAVWLLGSGLVGLVGIRRRKKVSS